MAASSNLRKGWTGIGVPVEVTGIGGPGAPHAFVFERREDVQLQDGEVIDNKIWGFDPHPHDVILRSGCFSCPNLAGANCYQFPLHAFVSKFLWCLSYCSKRRSFVTSMSARIFR